MCGIDDMEEGGARIPLILGIASNTLDLFESSHTSGVMPLTLSGFECSASIVVWSIDLP
jgi:hypothetical protein